MQSYRAAQSEKFDAKVSKANANMAPQILCGAPDSMMDEFTDLKKTGIGGCIVRFRIGPMPAEFARARPAAVHEGHRARDRRADAGDGVSRSARRMLRHHAPGLSRASTLSDKHVRPKDGMAGTSPAMTMSVVLATAHFHAPQP